MIASQLASAEDSAENPPASEDEETMVVIGSRSPEAQRASTAAVQVIDRGRIEASGATTLGDVLRTAPGLQVTPSRGGVAVSQRGMDPKHTLILLDGRPLAGRVDGVVDLSRIPVADIERIEILPGPASALYGSEALGGVVNVVTRRGGDGVEVAADVRAGSRALLEASGEASFGTGPVRAGVSGFRNAQRGWDAFPDDPPTTGRDAVAWGARSWARYAPSAAWTFDVDGDYGQRDTRGLTGSGAGALFDERTLQEMANASLAARYWDGQRSTLTARIAASAWRQQFLEDQRGSPLQDAYEDTLDHRLASNLQWRFAPTQHLVTVGFDGWREVLRSDRLGGGAADRLRGAVYVQDDWRLLPEVPRFALAPGVRVDVDSQFGWNVTPNLALRFDPTDALQLRLSGGRGYRAPDFKELYLAFDHSSYGYTLAGNPDLRPEHSLGGNLDVQWTVAALADVHLRGWWDEVTDLVNPELVAESTQSSAAIYAYDNIGRAVSRGGEVGVSTVGTGRWKTRIDYAWTDARDRATGLRLDGRAPHRLTANGAVPVGRRWLASANLEWSSPRPYTVAGETTWGPATAWADARLAWQSPWNVSVDIGARNLLNTRDDAFQVLPPRTVYAGVRGGFRSAKEQQ